MTESIGQHVVVAPEKHPPVRWHSQRHVCCSRFVGSLGLLLVALLVFLMFGPPLITVMYPSIISPFVPSLEWRYTPLPGYSGRVPSRLGLETNLLTTSAVHIQIYLRENRTTFDDIEHVWLVIDDGTFDHLENVVMCRPYVNFGARPTFTEYVAMAETCYLYVRQLVKKASIIGYGRGIGGNVLLAAAVTLRRDNCYQFEKIHLEDPIPNIRDELGSSSWMSVAFLFPVFRNLLISNLIHDRGLDAGELDENVKRVGNVPIFIQANKLDADNYKGLGGPVEVIRAAKFKKELSLSRHPVSPSKSGFEFRHSTEEECADELNKPVTLLHILA